jgi:hypothetical protein
VLDLGNGGLLKDFQFGKDLSLDFSSYVAIDKSFAMLTRNGFMKNQMVADALQNFASNSFDYVIMSR